MFQTEEGEPFVQHMIDNQAWSENPEYYLTICDLNEPDEEASTLALAWEKSIASQVEGAADNEDTKQNPSEVKLLTDRNMPDLHPITKMAFAAIAASGGTDEEKYQLMASILDATTKQNGEQWRSTNRDIVKSCSRIGSGPPTIMTDDKVQTSSKIAGTASNQSNDTQAGSETSKGGDNKYAKMFATFQQS